MSLGTAATAQSEPWGTDPVRSTAVPVGALAPPFALPATDGSEHRLADYRGAKVVVVFYRGHWCGVCRQQLAALRAAIETFEDAGAAVLAISAEPLERARASALADNLPFTILSDEGLSVIDRYGLRGPSEPETGGQPIARPSVFVLDRLGIVRFAHVGEDPLDRPTTLLILLALESLP